MHNSNNNNNDDERYVLSFDEIDETQVALVGGKGASLGELARIRVRVPPGFCVTTNAFRRISFSSSFSSTLINELSRLQANDRDAIRTQCAEVRRMIEGIVIPDDLAEAITRALTHLAENAAGYAVRSSATAEDLPTASFAGQQDTYLNVAGDPAVILEHVSKCWASLFTERAVTYRLRNGFDHRKIHMAVVVQQMAAARASGVLFTADPISGNRKVSSVEAVLGLGESLVSGLVNADVYKVRGGGNDDEITKSIVSKEPVLTDEQAIELVRLGRRIEAHFGRPQDIEWCLVADAHGSNHFEIVQSRPITTLFPIPAVTDNENHVYLSVGHQQMMTDPLKPLGLSLKQLVAIPVMHEAGGRLFVEVTRMLASAARRAGLMAMAGKSDPLTGDAIQTIVDRGFIPSIPDKPADEPGAAPPPTALAAPLEIDSAIVAELIEQNQRSVAALKRDIVTKSGPALLDFILTDDIKELKRLLIDPRSHQVFMTAIEASWWLNEHLSTWLGEKNAADTLTQSVDNNITSEMGLALMDVADVIRAHPTVVTFLQQVSSGALEIDDEDFLNELPSPEARDALQAFLDKYGMRCAGEIDITRPRWSERPKTLVPMILNNIKNFEAGAGKRRFEQGRQEALKKEQEVLERLRALPSGEEKAEETKRMIDRVRTFIGYREYPKYGMVSRYAVYKQALLKEAKRLVQSHVIREKEDIFYLTVQELHDVLRTNDDSDKHKKKNVDERLIQQRKDAFRSYEALTPPRVLTSDGECVSGTYRREDLPVGPNVLIGLAVSSGTVEGRARVILDMEKADDLEPDDILVTAFTDPSWTPLFVAIKGLVTEVGGLMTHGAVIAREYGLPAVVGIERATRRIRDGQRIRVHGSDGYVELLSTIATS